METQPTPVKALVAKIRMENRSREIEMALEHAQARLEQLHWLLDELQSNDGISEEMQASLEAMDDVVGDAQAAIYDLDELINDPDAA